nr:MAG TPA: hypothetical protein [Caudoviricetes sp.]
MNAERSSGCRRIFLSDSCLRRSCIWMISLTEKSADMSGFDAFGVFGPVSGGGQILRSRRVCIEATSRGGPTPFDLCETVGYPAALLS